MEVSASHWGEGRSLDSLLVWIKPRPENEGCKIIHMIEHSAYTQLLEQAEAMAEVTKNAILEARLHLEMYIKAYKQEPYDTGVMLEVYIKESLERIQKQQEQALESWQQYKKERE